MFVIFNKISKAIKMIMLVDVFQSLYFCIIHSSKKNSLAKKKTKRCCLVNAEKCSGCRICEKNCPCSAIKIVSKYEYHFDAKKCIYCFLCTKLCPTSAIKFVNSLDKTDAHDE